MVKLSYALQIDLLPDILNRTEEVILDRDICRGFLELSLDVERDIFYRIQLWRLCWPLMKVV